MSDDERASDQVGSVAEEAMRLVASMTAWAQEHGDATASAEAANETSDGEPAEPAVDGAEQTTRMRPQGHLEGIVCGVCPLCRGASFLDHLPSETIAKAADLLGFFAGALGDLAAHRAERESTGDAPTDPAP